MQQDSELSLDHALQSDPTWHVASACSRKYFTLPSHVEHLFRSGWLGELSVEEYVRTIGFSRLEPQALLVAADTPQNVKGRAAMENAISVLGSRYAAVVLAINHFALTVQESSRSPHLEKWLQILMNNVEIGYQLGGKAFAIGVEGGSVCGLAQCAGQLLLQCEFPDQFEIYQRELEERKKISPATAVELFGCEPYQVASCVVQRFGFGKEAALGIALAGNNDTTSPQASDPAILRWKASYLWIESLWTGRNYPADPEIRAFFDEIRPPGRGERNMNLEVLYTEVARIRQRNSNWSWHLTRGKRSDEKPPPDVG